MRTNTTNVIFYTPLYCDFLRVVTVPYLFTFLESRPVSDYTEDTH